MAALKGAASEHEGAEASTREQHGSKREYIGIGQSGYPL